LLIALLQHSTNPPGGLWKFLSDPSNLIATVRTLATVISAVVAFLVFWPSWRQRRVNKMLARDFGADFYSPEILDRSTKYYVVPNCTSVDPSFESELRNLVVTEENLFLVIDRFLDKNSSHRHLLLLADSGMGKSSCLLNYYVRNRSLAERRRKNIAIVPLGIPGADKSIQGVSNKREAILFLDAFDEDTKAIQDHRERLRQLMDLAGEFRRIIITCRTQFFLRDEEIPRETGIIRIEPRKAGERGIYEFQKLYLAPLNDRQVERYLRKRYSAWHLARRRKARELVRAVPLLSVRPMLLAYIPDLLESSPSIRNAFQLYGALVNSWIERESRWVPRENLGKFSEHLAVDLYCKRGQRSAEHTSGEELVQLARQWRIPLESWQLTGRSLLNRDAAGNFKFAHRSIMEYFFAKRIWKGDPATKAVEWTDQMIEFLRDMAMNEEVDVNLQEEKLIHRLRDEPRVSLKASCSLNAHADEPPTLTGEYTISNSNPFSLTLRNLGVIWFFEGDTMIAINSVNLYCPARQKTSNFITPSEFGPSNASSLSNPSKLTGLRVFRQLSRGREVTTEFFVNFRFESPLGEFSLDRKAVTTVGIDGKCSFAIMDDLGK
jgi:hypothetical protein